MPGTPDQAYVAALDSAEVRIPLGLAPSAPALAAHSPPGAQPEGAASRLERAPPPTRRRHQLVPRRRHQLVPLQEYMAAQAALSEALRAGFLSLAQARYSMGADRVSALQIPAHLVAAARVKPAGERRVVPHLSHASASPPCRDNHTRFNRLSAEDGNLQLVLTDPSAPPSLRASPASSSSWEAAATPQPAAGVSPDSGAATAAGDTTACAGTSRGVTDAASHVAGSASIEDRLQQLRLAAQQSDSFVEQLAAKYGCEGSNPVRWAEP